MAGASVKRSFAVKLPKSKQNFRGLCCNRTEENTITLASVFSSLYGQGFADLLRRPTYPRLHWFTEMFILFTGHHSLSASRYSPYSPNAPYSPSGHCSTRPKPACVDVGTNTSLPGCVNGRSPDLPANPVTWSVEQVVRYVRSTDCMNYANIFLDQVSSCFWLSFCGIPRFPPRC